MSSPLTSLKTDPSVSYEALPYNSSTKKTPVTVQITGKNGTKKTIQISIDGSKPSKIAVEKAVSAAAEAFRNPVVASSKSGTILEGSTRVKTSSGGESEIKHDKETQSIVTRLFSLFQGETKSTIDRTALVKSLGNAYERRGLNDPCPTLPHLGNTCHLASAIQIMALFVDTLMLTSDNGKCNKAAASLLPILVNQATGKHRVSRDVFEAAKKYYSSERERIGSGNYNVHAQEDPHDDLIALLRIFDGAHMAEHARLGNRADINEVCDPRLSITVNTKRSFSGCTFDRDYFGASRRPQGNFWTQAEYESEIKYQNGRKKEDKRSFPRDPRLKEIIFEGTPPVVASKLSVEQFEAAIQSGRKFYYVIKGKPERMIDMSIAMPKVEKGEKKPEMTFEYALEREFTPNRVQSSLLLKVKIGPKKMRSYRYYIVTGQELIEPETDLLNGAPPILLFHYKRYTEVRTKTGYAIKKLTHAVRPPESSALTLKSSDGKKYLYELCCAGVHSGSTGGGHHVAMQRFDKRWELNNDLSSTSDPLEEDSENKPLSPDSRAYAFLSNAHILGFKLVKIEEAEDE